MVAIIAICVTVILGGITIWHAASYYGEQKRISEQLIISNKIDNIVASVQDIKVAIARMGQRLDDHLERSHNK